MDDGHVYRLIGEHLSSLDPSEQASAKSAIEASRQLAKSLQPIDLQSVVVRQLTGDHINRLIADARFVQVFQERPLQFAWVRADKLIAVQTTVSPRREQCPTSEQELIDFCLPHQWEVPAEVSFTPPVGPIQVTSSAPTLNNLNFEMDASGRIIISPVPHINLVQVREFQGRYFLANGYHRVHDLLSCGVVEIPAIVIKAFDMQEVDLGQTGFGIGYLMGLPRPPLVGDFTGPASIETKIRERRFGVMVNFDMKPFSVGI